MAIRTCLIIGAGLSGLIAARTLQQHGVQVTVLDKGRGVGGRMATRHIDKAVFDHGAQYFTARDDRFVRLVNKWIEAGIVVEWAQGFHAAQKGEITPAGLGQARYRGKYGMTDIPKYLAQGLDVRLEQTVTRVDLRDDGWHVAVQSGAVFNAQALLLTPPIPQSLQLLDTGSYRLPENIRAELEVVGATYAPCFAVMATLDRPSQIPDPGSLWLSGNPVSWIADNHCKGISPNAYAVTIHAGTGFSREHFDHDQDEVAHLMLDACSEWLGAAVCNYQVHRWRYSIPELVYSEPCLFMPGKYPLAMAGEAYFGPRVEGAAMSGLMAAEQLVTS
ncbi:MAG: FAD-dependent oxidoreductase [Anaerolineae bacterium]